MTMIDYYYRAHFAFSVAPKKIQILDEKKALIKNGTTLGPLREGQSFSATCLVEGARPKPTVGWYRAGKRLHGKYCTHSRKLPSFRFINFVSARIL